MKTFIIFLKQGGCFVRVAPDYEKAIEMIITDNNHLMIDDILHVEECENGSYMCKYKKICVEIY